MYNFLNFIRDCDVIVILGKKNFKASKIFRAPTKWIIGNGNVWFCGSWKNSAMWNLKFVHIISLAFTNIFSGYVLVEHFY